MGEGGAVPHVRVDRGWGVGGIPISFVRRTMLVLLYDNCNKIYNIVQYEPMEMLMNVFNYHTHIHSLTAVKDEMGGRACKYEGELFIWRSILNIKYHILYLSSCSVRPGLVLHIPEQLLCTP